MTTLLYTLSFLPMLLLTLTVHELGHLAMARLKRGQGDGLPDRSGAGRLPGSTRGGPLSGWARSPKPWERENRSPGTSPLSLWTGTPERRNTAPYAR